MSPRLSQVRAVALVMFAIAAVPGAGNACQRPTV